MQPDIEIVCTYRRSDSLSTIQEDHNNLTRESDDMNYNPRDPLSTAPLHGILPVLRTCHVYVYVYGYIYGPTRIRCLHDHLNHCTDVSRVLP